MNEINEYAQYAIDFIGQLKHTKGQWYGCNFNLLPWQSNDVVIPLFGNVDENGFRIYRKCYVEIPKKNGKSELAAAIALFLLIADQEPGAEIYGAACDREQASIVFNVAASMVEQNPALRKRLKVLKSTKRILYPAMNSYYHVLSSDVPAKHGFNAHGVIFDELHAQPNRELWDVLTEGSGDARRQSLIFAITTAGYNKNSICYEVHDYARKVKEGIIKDPRFLPVIYNLSEKANWRDKRNWKKVNPSLGHTITIDKIQDSFRECEHIPAKQNIFRRLRLNQWTSSSERWLDMAFWDKCGKAVNIKQLKGKSCYCGLDLASSIDIAAFAKAFLDEKGFFDILMRFWVPEENIRERS